MALLTESALRNLATQDPQRSCVKSAEALLREAAGTLETTLSTCSPPTPSKTQTLVLGVVAALKNQGLKVYVDWLVDPQIDSSRLTPETAERLRQRMRRPRCSSMRTRTSRVLPVDAVTTWHSGSI